MINQINESIETKPETFQIYTQKIEKKKHKKKKEKTKIKVFIYIRNPKNNKKQLNNDDNWK